MTFTPRAAPAAADRKHPPRVRNRVSRYEKRAASLKESAALVAGSTIFY
jgi:ribosomal protein S30